MFSRCKRKALWDRRDLSFPSRMKETRLGTVLLAMLRFLKSLTSVRTRTMVADSLSKVLEPMGYAPGRLEARLARSVAVAFPVFTGLA